MKRKAKWTLVAAPVGIEGCIACGSRDGASSSDLPRSPYDMEWTAR